MRSQYDDYSERAPGQLIVRTVPVADPGDLISRLPEPDTLAWVRRGEGIIGWGTVARITLPAGADRFAAGEKWLRELFDSARVADEVAVPGTGPVAFGSFTFDPTSDGSVLVIPRAVLGRRAGTYWLTTIGAEPEHAGDGMPLPGVPDMPDWPKVPLQAPTGLRWSDGRLTAPEWERAVATAVDAIARGQLRKVVLALELNVTAAQDIDSRVLLSRLAERYPDCYAFACAGLLGATPELLIRRTGSQVYSLVLAGTMARGSTPEQDTALGNSLLASAKDQEEHQYAVADVRSALAPLCADLRIDDEPFLLRLANVQHLATEVHGELAAGEAAKPSALALAAALHPTAAVCGTPAEAAMELIRELEHMDRARWSGPAGWVDSKGNGEWGIALRCGEISGRNARLIAGCGIVAGSDPSTELAEAQTKFRPMRHALEG
ncbi:MAG TPA: isochorismate synthase [Streptosporangiaceae bacterium]|nr:isochorismate synthase [Streptosporangiaceae bacterium]